MKIQIHKAQKTANRLNRHPIFRLPKVKMRTLKAAQGKQLITYIRNSMSMPVVISTESLWARKEWNDIFKTFEE